MNVNINNVKSYLLKKEITEKILRQKGRDAVISKLRDIRFIWDKYRIDKVYLYGSFADMTFDKYSDIDIAIEPEISFEELLQLFSEINKYIENEVDVRVLTELPFSDKVRREGIVIYERENSNTQE